MAIYEIGVIKNGILMVNRSYYDSDNGNNSENQGITRSRPQVINAISKLSRLILNESVKYIQYNDKLIAVYSNDVSNDDNQPSLNNEVRKENNDSGPTKSNIAVYCIGSNDLRKFQPLSLLSKISKKFIEMYAPFSNRIEDINAYADFKVNIDRILKDIQFKPIDRLRMGIL